MPGCYVYLLDQWCRIRGHPQAQIAARRHFAPGSAGEAHGNNPLFSRRVDRAQNVRRTARRRYGDEDISGAAETEDLALEESVVAVVVADGRENQVSVVSASAAAGARS